MNTQVMLQPDASRRLALAAAFVTGFIAAGVSVRQAEAAGFIDVEGVRFATEIQARSERLDLRGTALLRWRSLFRAFVSALYLPPMTSPGDVLGDVPKRLEIEYFRAIRAEDLGRAADDLLERNLSKGTLETLRSRLDELHAAYESVEPGDRYAIDYRPGAGTELSKNGRPLTVIPGADFAAAYFSIWLGERPIDPVLRDRLLRGSLMGTLPMRAQQ